MRDSVRVGISITCFLVGWELVARAGIVPAPLFPPPTGVIRALHEMATAKVRWPTGCCVWIPGPLQNDLVLDLGVSLQRGALGWAIGSLAGIVIGVLTGRLPVLNSYLAPIIQIFRPLPPVAIIPVIIVWFGIGDISKIFSIAFAVFFPVWINSHIGAQKIPKSFIWSAQSLRTGRFTMLRRVIFPGSLPFVAAGLRTGISVAFVMVYVSELAGASAGIGYEISSSHLSYRVDRMLGALLLLGAAGASADLLLSKALNSAFPWLRYSVQR